MLFNSLTFAVFFAVVCALYFPFRHRVGPRNLLLLVASYVFYGAWDWRFLGLIVFSTVVDYAVGRGFAAAPRQPGRPASRRHRALLLASLTANLGLLGFFKYWDFFAESAAEALNALGLQAHPFTLGVLLPVGISFYTFQTLSYTIDLYRGTIQAERSLLTFSVYVAFFPQLVAGPIERASHLLPQFRSVRPVLRDSLREGLFLIAWGLFKKVVIADNVSQVADAVYSGAVPSGLEVVVGTWAFAIQIYCDFSGYTDIARGTAQVLGFDLMRNFDLPYFATNPREFWRRWHISLSTWLRDYLYISLGGNRLGSRRTAVNLMATMVLGGLWHGAAWTFVAWGAFHGALLGIHRAWDAARPGRDVGGWRRALLTAGFFQLVCVGWLLFRATSIGQAGQLLGAVAGLLSDPGAAWTSAVLSTRLWGVFLACSVVFWGAQLLQWRTGDLYFVLRAPVPVRAGVYAALWLGFLVFGQFHGDQFIYFQF